MSAVNSYFGVLVVYLIFKCSKLIFMQNHTILNEQFGTLSAIQVRYYTASGISPA